MCKEQSQRADRWVSVTNTILLSDKTCTKQFTGDREADSFHHLLKDTANPSWMTGRLEILTVVCAKLHDTLAIFIYGALLHHSSSVKTCIQLNMITWETLYLLVMNLYFIILNFRLVYKVVIFIKAWCYHSLLSFIVFTHIMYF